MAGTSRRKHTSWTVWREFRSFRPCNPLVLLYIYSQETKRNRTHFQRQLLSLLHSKLSEIIIFFIFELCLYLIGAEVFDRLQQNPFELLCECFVWFIGTIVHLWFLSLNSTLSHVTLSLFLSEI